MRRNRRMAMTFLLAVAACGTEGEEPTPSPAEEPGQDTISESNISQAPAGRTARVTLSDAQGATVGRAELAESAEGVRITANATGPRR